MYILGIELIDGDSFVIKNLKKGWYSFFNCAELTESPKDKKKYFY